MNLEWLLLDFTCSRMACSFMGSGVVPIFTPNPKTPGDYLTEASRTADDVPRALAVRAYQS